MLCLESFGWQLARLGERVPRVFGPASIQHVSALERFREWGGPIGPPIGITIADVHVEEVAVISVIPDECPRGCVAQLIFELFLDDVEVRPVRDALGKAPADRGDVFQEPFLSHGSLAGVMFHAHGENSGIRGRTLMGGVSRTLPLDFEDAISGGLFRRDFFRATLRAIERVFSCISVHLRRYQEGSWLETKIPASL